MSNILEAIYNISRLEDLSIASITFGSNRANNMGEGLESFVKDAFAGVFDEVDKNKRNLSYGNIYSFQGSKRNPPDLMIKSGPAIEVKKVESLTSELQLNSSHPKTKLVSTSKLITKKCRDSEVWTEKDFIYVVGHIPKGTKTLSSLWFVYGDIYAAAAEIYTSLKEEIGDTIENIPGIDFSETKEIGRVNQADPLKITNLRIRGMWLIQQPYSVFDYIHGYEKGRKFQCFAIIPTTKYETLPTDSIEKINSIPNNLSIEDVKVNEPDNPVNLIDCKLIRYVI